MSRPVTNGRARTEDTAGEQGAGQAAAQRPLQPEAYSAPGGSQGETFRQRVEARCAALEEELAAWRRRNSQSNPSAAGERREIQAELTRWRTLLRVTQGYR